jgi:cobalt-zinc-cadmium efflux system outer membrane protein
MVALVVWLPFTPARAQVQGEMTVASLVQHALRQNRELLAMRKQVDWTRGGLTQARLRPNPAIEISGLRQANGTDNNLSVGASLPLELFGRRERRVEVAERELELMQYEVSDRERQLAAEIRSKYGEILAAGRNVRFAAELLELNRDAVQLVSARVEKGATAPLERGLTGVEQDRIAALQAQFDARAEVHLLELKNLAGMKPEDPLRLKEDWEITSAVLDREAAVARALAERPDLAAARVTEALAEAHLRQARTGAMPDASLFANYQRTDFGFDVNGLTAAGSLRRVQGIYHYFTFGVSLSLPVRNKNQGAIEAALARVEAARLRREFAETVVSREVAAAYARLDRARQAMEIYSRGVRGQARDNLGVIRRTYELGRTPLLDVIAEQRRYIDIETGYTEVMNQYYQAAVELERAVGSTAKPGEANARE